MKKQKKAGVAYPVKEEVKIKAKTGESKPPRPRTRKPVLYINISRLLSVSVDVRFLSSIPFSRKARQSKPKRFCLVGVWNILFLSLKWMTKLFSESSKREVAIFSSNHHLLLHLRLRFSSLFLSMWYAFLNPCENMLVHVFVLCFSFLGLLLLLDFVVGVGIYARLLWRWYSAEKWYFLFLVKWAETCCMCFYSVLVS